MRQSASLCIAVSVSLTLVSACALSHQRVADASADGTWVRSDRECTRPVTERSPLSAEQHAGLLQRLRHELSHLADAVAGIASGTLPERDDWTFTEDRGSMVVSGHLTMHDDLVELVAEITFAHWTGRHGGWGYAALEGVACATIVVGRGTGREDPVTTVDAAVSLVDEVPLLGSPPANVHYVSAGSSLHGTIAGEPIGDGE